MPKTELQKMAARVRNLVGRKTGEVTLRLAQEDRTAANGSRADQFAGLWLRLDEALAELAGEGPAVLKVDNDATGEK